MGTNYYVVENECDCCNRYDVKYHIGKSSFGWAFSFRGYPYDNITSWQDWKEYLKDKVIRDEYGQQESYEAFVNYVENLKSPKYVLPDGRRNLVHNEKARMEGWFNPEHCWDDSDGYSFTSREFL